MDTDTGTHTHARTQTNAETRTHSYMRKDPAAITLCSNCAAYAQNHIEMTFKVILVAI